MTISNTPLNPTLFAALQASFDEVDIDNVGERRLVDHFPRWSESGRTSLRPVQRAAGESYRVSCPFCHDTRKRLYVNHHYAVPDPVSRTDNRHLAICFNEDCVAEALKRDRLYELIYPYNRRHRSVMQRLIPGAVMTPLTPARTAPVFTGLPRDAIPVDRMPEGHRARVYLEQRGFEANELSTRWGVRYCEPSQAVYSNRLLIPMRTLRMTFTAGHVVQEVGWQARAVLPNHDPKYLNSTGLRKSELLYGLPEAVSTEGPIVLVEGVTDVWRLASNAVALLGKTMSAQQVTLLGRHLSERPIVVLLDSDASQDAERIRTQLRQMRQTRQDHSPIRLGILPPGRSDVGECTHDEAWAAVEAALRQAELAGRHRAV